MVTSYEVVWQRVTTTGECPDVDGGSDTITDTSYEITGLEEDSSYSITVRAINTAGSSEVSVPAMTLEAGERELLQVHIFLVTVLYNVHVYYCLYTVFSNIQV